MVAPQHALSLRVSNDGGFAKARTIRVSPTGRYQWTLDSSGSERLPKTVYVRFGSATSQSAQTFTDDIILDQTRPAITSATLMGGGSAATAASLRPRSYSLRIRAHDKTSGVSKFQVAADKRRPAGTQPYRQRTSVRTTRRPRFIRARDRAGNWSRWRRLR